MAKISRTRGVNWERRVAVDLRKAFPDSKRFPQFSMGAASLTDSDIIGTPFWLECSASSTVPLKELVRRKLNQAKDDRAAYALERGSTELLRPIALALSIHRAEKWFFFAHEETKPCCALSSWDIFSMDPLKLAESLGWVMICPTTPRLLGVNYEKLVRRLDPENDGKESQEPSG